MPRTLLILGAGTGGTMLANKLAHTLDHDQWQMIIVDQEPEHYYQPGFLFIPFGIYRPDEVIRPKQRLLPASVKLIFSEIALIEPDQQRVKLVKDDQVIPYDYLVIATGSRIAPDEIDGMLGDGWYQNIFDFYTYPGAVALAEALKNWKGGRLVINIAEMPIKCPVAPLEFAFLADWYFAQRGIRDQVEIIYSTPLSGAFTKPRASATLSRLLDEKRITVIGDFNISEVDAERRVIRSYDDQEIPYDLLVTIPPNMGAEVIGRSGMGDDLNFVPVDKHTLQSKRWENVFVIGDAGNVPTSKAGSVAHFMLETVVENLQHHISGEPLTPSFDGHANCFVETGYQKGLLIDFNYEVEPLPGKYPLPTVGPFSLLEETKLNHLGKMGFRWVYWNVLLKAIDLPISSQFSMTGKIS
ncbi:MAG: NAD(P)/FAD-dependent oxidoreductase [Anaerolineae bacterium]|jgi:sulfide:quinone oxidoreductase|nr:NAD(P)/FAD-dependent oxidoreductase [Anaerolineae bacterium]